MVKSTLALKKADDLFEKSAMSFGDHLEELRRAIAKSAICLGIGLLIGLPMASRVVKYMQVPLENSLKKYYIEKSRVEMAASSGGDVSPALSKWMIDNEKVSQVVYRDINRFRDAIHGKLSDSAKSQPDSGGLPKSSDLVAFREFVAINASTEALGLQEPFLIWFKAGLVVAVIVASPGIFYFIWQFVSAGLYPHERRYVYFFLPTSLGLFWAGAFLAFFVIFGLVIDFLLNFNASMGIGASPRLTDYMSFALLLPLGFGVSFQLPLVMLVLERLGIFTVQTYFGQWRMAILIIAFISMILTPADVGSMIGMGLPLIGLYFVGIAMCKFLPRSAMFRGDARDPV